MKTFKRLLRLAACSLLALLPAFSACMAAPAPQLLVEYGIGIVLPDEIAYVERGFDPASPGALALTEMDVDIRSVQAAFDETPAHCLYGHSSETDLQIQIIVEKSHADNFGDISDEQLAASYREDFLSILKQSVTYADSLDVSCSVYSHPQTRFIVTSVTPPSTLYRMTFGHRLQFYTVSDRKSVFITFISHTGGIDPEYARSIIDTLSFTSAASSSEIVKLLTAHSNGVLFLVVFGLFALIMLIYSLTHRHSLPEQTAYAVVMLTMAGFFLLYVFSSLLLSSVFTLEFAYMALPAVLSIIYIRLLSIRPVRQEDKDKPTVSR